LGDSGDTGNKAYATTVPILLNKRVSAIVGAAASDVTAVVIDQIVGSGTVLFSPANSATQFTTWKDDGLYWRTASTNQLRGEVLGNLIAADGAHTLGIIAINGAYGTGLQKVIAAAFEDAGGAVVATELFNTGDTNFAAQIASVLAQKPDAIQLISENEASTIIPALKNAGFDTSKLYLADGNTVQYGSLFAPAMLTGAKGILPGPIVTEDFQKRLVDLWAANNNGAKLTNFGFAAESYDAVALLALASLAAKSTDSKAIASKLREVSGGSGNGKKATTFASAAKIINAGGIVDYDGFSGGVKFDENGDAGEASIGIYEYDAENNYKRINK
jgi:branched-chain amino acid transport system substrate-binding protein